MKEIRKVNTAKREQEGKSKKKDQFEISKILDEHNSKKKTATFDPKRRWFS